MQKFSKINKFVVPTEKIEKYDISERDQLKATLYRIMDENLTIQTYGPVDRYQKAGTIKVKGKEMAVEAILDALEMLVGEKTIKVLESLKYKTNDWMLINSLIEAVHTQNTKVINNNIQAKQKIKALRERWGEDTQTLEIVSKTKISKIDDINILSENLKMVQEIIDETQDSIYKIIEQQYKKRISEL